MEVVLLLLLFPCPTAQEGLLATIQGVTATNWNGYGHPDKAIDNNIGSYFHSQGDMQPKWLRLTFSEKYHVEKVKIINR